MDMREAFDSWYHGDKPFVIWDAWQIIAWNVWQAACEWQKQKDAELVRSDPWSESQILNQDK